MKKKIKEIMDYYGLNQKEFAIRINVVPQTISDILKSKRNSGNKVTHGILESFQDINPLWLLRDVGKMLLDGHQMEELKKKKVFTDLKFKNLDELALFCSNNEDELMKIKTFSNIIDKNSANKILEMITRFRRS